MSFLYPVNWPWHKIPKLCCRPCWARGHSSSAPSQEQYLSRTWQIAWKLPRWRTESHKGGTSPRRPHPARIFPTFPHDTQYQTTYYGESIAHAKNIQPCHRSAPSHPSQSHTTPQSTAPNTHREIPGSRDWSHVGIEVFWGQYRKKEARAFVITAGLSLAPDANQGGGPDYIHQLPIYTQRTNWRTSATTAPPTHVPGCRLNSNGAANEKPSRASLDTEACLALARPNIFSPRPPGSPTGLQSGKFSPYRVRLPARAARSGGTHAPQTRWRAITD